MKHMSTPARRLFAAPAEFDAADEPGEVLAEWLANAPLDLQAQADEYQRDEIASSNGPRIPGND